MSNDRKQEIRKFCRKNRSALSADEVRVKSNEICNRLMNHSKVQQTGQVLVYSAIHNEVDLRELVEQLWMKGKAVAFPRVLHKDEANNYDVSNPDKLSAKLVKEDLPESIADNDMEFYEISEWNQLATGAFGILEPKIGLMPIIPRKDAVICVPGVAFSSEGSRIGMGRGYYDRYLSRYPYLYKIGVAYEVQMGYNWEADPLDVPMDVVVTEQG